MKWFKKYTAENENDTKLSLMATCFMNSFAALAGSVFVVFSLRIAITFFNHDALSWMDFKDPAMIFLAIQYNYPLFIVPPVISLVIFLFAYMAISDFKKIQTLLTTEAN